MRLKRKDKHQRMHSQEPKKRTRTLPGGDGVREIDKPLNPVNGKDSSSWRERPLCPTEPRQEPGQEISSKVRNSSRADVGQVHIFSEAATAAGQPSPPSPTFQVEVPKRAPSFSPPATWERPKATRPSAQPEKSGTYCWSRRPRWAFVALQPHGSLQGRKAASLTCKGVSKTTVVIGKDGGGEKSSQLTIGPGSPRSPGKPLNPAGPSFPGKPAGPGSPCKQDRGSDRLETKPSRVPQCQPRRRRLRVLNSDWRSQMVSEGMDPLPSLA